METFWTKIHFDLDWVATEGTHKGQKFEYVVGYYTSQSDDFKSTIELEILENEQGYNAIIGFQMD
jgi:hypothetical protein